MPLNKETIIKVENLISYESDLRIMRRNQPERKKIR